MSAFAKALFDNVVGVAKEGPITRVDSPKIVQETKSKDFDTSSVRSPMFSRRAGISGRGLSSHHQVDGLSPAAAERAFNMRYTIENDHFAKGAYGKIEIARDRMTQERVAIKRIPKSTPIKMIQAEVRAGQQLGYHANIATFHKYHDFGDLHTLIFQFIEGQDLFTHLETIGFTPKTDTESRSIILDIINAVHHTHSKGIAHRDIKLENILIDANGKAFLIDYGLCANIEDGKLNREWCGSDNYLAPQIVRRTPYDPKQADVFSIGVVLFALVFGVFPFECLQVNSRYSNDPSRPLPRLRVRFPTDVKASREVKDLLVAMLEDDPDIRITIDEILKHKWITGQDEPILTMQSCE